MKNKTKIFTIPYIGYDYGKKLNQPFDVLIGEYGNPIIGIKLKNKVEQYAADPDLYLENHQIIKQVVSILGEERMLQEKISSRSIQSIFTTEIF